MNVSLLSDRALLNHHTKKEVERYTVGMSSILGAILDAIDAISHGSMDGDEMRQKATMQPSQVGLFTNVRQIIGVDFSKLVAKSVGRVDYT